MANITRTLVDPAVTEVDRIRLHYEGGTIKSVGVAVVITTQETGEKEIREVMFNADQLSGAVQTSLNNLATAALNKTRNLLGFA